MCIGHDCFTRRSIDTIVEAMTFHILKERIEGSLDVRMTDVSREFAFKNFLAGIVEMESMLLSVLPEAIDKTFHWALTDAGIHDRVEKMNTTVWVARKPRQSCAVVRVSKAKIIFWTDVISGPVHTIANGKRTSAPCTSTIWIQHIKTLVRWRSPVRSTRSIAGSTTRIARSETQMTCKLKIFANVDRLIPMLLKISITDI